MYGILQRSSGYVGALFRRRPASFQDGLLLPLFVKQLFLFFYKKKLQKLTEVSLLEARPGRPFRRLMGLLELSGALQGPLERTASCLGAAWGRLGALKVRWGSL